jgi:hypothetical protein
VSEVDRPLPTVRGPSAAPRLWLKLSITLVLQLCHPANTNVRVGVDDLTLVTAGCKMVGQLRRTHSMLRSAGVLNHPGKRCLKCCAMLTRWRAPKETTMGRRLLVPLILAAMLLTVAVPAGTASAKPGAMVLRDIGCGIDLNGVPPFVAFTDNARIVATPSGRAVLVCHAEIPTGPSSAVIIEDLPCFVGPAGVTDQSHTVITPSGKVLLTCHINPSDLAQLRAAATLGTASGATGGGGVTQRTVSPSKGDHTSGRLARDAGTDQVESQAATTRWSMRGSRPTSKPRQATAGGVGPPARVEQGPRGQGQGRGHIRRFGE